MADGSIRIETKLDNSALKQQIKELERKLKDIQKEQAKVDAQADGARAKYQAEREFDSQFPEEFSHRQDIDERADKELDPIIAKQEELNQKEQTYLAMLDAAKAKLTEQANVMSASKQVDNAVKSDSAIAKVQTQAQYNSLLDATSAKMAAIEAHAERISAKTGVSKEQILQNNAAYQKLSDTMGMLKGKAEQFGDKSKDAGQKAQDGLKRAKREANGFGTAIKGAIKKVGMMALAVFGIRGAFSAVRLATREYLATNEQLAAQMETLKAGFGQVLGPAIEWVINLLLKAVSAVNSFVYALSGINFVAKANTAALNKQAKAAGGAAKAAQLAGFDEQTKLNDTSGGGGGSAVGLLDASVGELSDFGEKLKNQILAGDWFGAGETVGTAIMNGIMNIDWVTAGNTIGDILGGILSFALGLALSIDPFQLVGSLNGLLGGLMESLAGTIQTLDWADIGGKLVTALLFGVLMADPATAILTILFSPNSDKLVSGASELIGSIIGALAAAIVGMGQRIGALSTDIWDTIKSYFDDYVDWEGTPGEIIDGLWQGIKDALKGAGEWIYNNIWVPFRDGFKAAFEINSPSKKMEGFGGDIIDGLKNGITGGLAKIRNACTTIWEAIKGKFANVKDWFKEKFTSAWEAVKNVFSTGGKIFDGIKEGIESTFKTVVNGIISGLNKIIPKPFNAINSILNRIRSISVAGITPFSGLWGYNPLSVPTIPLLARGGIVNRPGRGVHAIIGEAGKEAVLPLENHTEWMDILADKIGGGTITIPIILDGKKIATYVVDIQKKKAFAVNGV